MHRDDLPPALEWEGPVWELYELVETQWRRAGMSGARTGLDYGPAIAVAAGKGWDLDLCLALLKAIEVTYLNRNADD